MPGTTASQEFVLLNKLFIYKDGFLFNRTSRSPRQLVGSIVGSLSDKGYLQFQLGKNYYKVHRVIYILEHGEIPEGFQVDHIDGNKLNNNIENLRLATNTENCNNKEKRKIPCSSQYKGVSFHKATGKWIAQINIDGKRTTIGLFDNELDASDAYIRKSKEIHGSFSKA